MQLILKGSTIQLRVSKTEVNRILSGYLLQETLYFGKENTFKYVLTSGDNSTLTAIFEKDTIKVIAPKERLEQWCKNNKDISFDQVINHAEGTSLYICVEKDYITQSDNSADTPG
jgi:hypothetical protein